MHYLAGDIGGTKALLAIALMDDAGYLDIVRQQRFECCDFSSLEAIVEKFLSYVEIPRSQIICASFGLPGPVSGRVVELTNLPWIVDADRLQKQCQLKHVEFINDFYAAALGVDLLKPTDLFKLFSPENHPENKKGNRLVIGAGTGLGVAPVFYDGKRYLPQASEGGHFDFAPISETQQQLLQWLWKRREHVSYERILSGAGLETLYEFFQIYEVPTTYTATSSQNINKNRIIDAQNSNVGLVIAESIQNSLKNTLQAPEIQHAAVAGDLIAEKALLEFVTIYGAFCGAVALVWSAPGGIYLAGGIAAKIQKWMRHPFFKQAYLEKGRMSTQVEKIPIYIVTDESLGLKGAMQNSFRKGGFE